MVVTIASGRFFRFFCSLLLLQLLLNIVTAQQGQDPPKADYSCSSSKPCKIGCCGKNNICGLGPDYCAKGNCTSSCDAKSECDPGWGAQWSTAEKCPLNVCCSKFGFCGTTSEFCGSKTVVEPSCGGSSTSSRTVAYYEGWSQTRACNGMAPENIPAGAYTHLNYAFAFVDPSSYAVAPMSDADIALYPRFTGLKESNPGLKTWISIGGWSMNDPDQPTKSTFSNLAGSSSAQSAFFKSLLSFMQTYGFDGVDFDWEYPVAPERSGKAADFDNYPKFLSNLKAALGSGGHNYGLSITLPSSYWYMRNFDIVKIEPIVDWFNVMTYDLHGTWDSTDPFIGSVVNAHTNLTEIQGSMDLLWRNNINPSKVVLGLGFYGRSFTLSNPSCSSPGCPFSSGGNAGPCSGTSGILLDSEIKSILASGATATLDSKAAVKEIVWDKNQWVSYDDADTFKMKLDWANSRCIGGTMVWAVSGDDSNATSSQALGITSGVLSKKSIWGGSTPQTQSLAQCIWGACAAPGKATCPGDSSPATTGQGKGSSNSAIYSGCPSGQVRNYCCPKDDVPVCNWVGTAPFCAHHSCNSQQVEVATDQSGTGESCWFNHKSLCCTATKSTSASGQCKWSGSAPFCASGSGKADCPDNFPDRLTYSSYGAGGESTCYSGYKSYCCTDPLPYKNCAWTTLAHSFLAPFTCAKGCPAGQQIVAESFRDHDNLNPCFHGTASYFCCDQFNQTTPTSNPPNYCSLDDNAYVETNEPDGDGNTADELELYWYEDECYPIPNTGNPDSMKRSIISVDTDSAGLRAAAWPAYTRNDGYPKLCDENGICVNILDPEQDLHFQYYRTLALNSSHIALWERGRVAKFCNAKGNVGQFRGANYPGTQGLANNGRRFFGVVKSGAKQGICLSLPLVEGVRQLGVKYVTEHVMELQTPAQFATSMLKGVLASGAQAPGFGYDWTKVFGSAGYMFKTWQQLGISQPPGLTGSTPAEAIYNALGSSNDIQNLQILDAATNSLKAAVWQIFENIVSDKRWDAAGGHGQVEIINRLYGTLIQYLNNGDVQNSLEHSYTAIDGAMKALDTAAKGTSVVGPSSTTFSLCWHTYFDDFLGEVQGNLHDFLDRRLSSSISFWKLQVAGNVPGADQVLTELQRKLANIANDVVINRGFMQ